jgi:NAD-dependent dihydropyrimidine dehydrogenase PreA subunit
MSATIEINEETCTGCKTCVKACFVDVMRWDDAKKKPIAAYQQDCVWCFTCEINCPAHSINVIPDLAGQRVNPF